MHRTVCVSGETTNVLIWDNLPAAEPTEREKGSLQRLPTIQPAIKHHHGTKTTLTAAHASCAHAGIQVHLNWCMCMHVPVHSIHPSYCVCFCPPEASGKHWTVIPSLQREERRIITPQAQNNRLTNKIFLLYPGFVLWSVKYIQHEI